MKKLTMKTLILSLLMLSAPNTKCLDFTGLMFFVGIPVAGGIIGAVIAETLIFAGHKIKQCGSSFNKKHKKKKSKKKINIPKKSLLAK